LIHQVNVPHLRFKLFKEDWKHIRCEELTELLSGYAFDSEDMTDNSKGIPFMRGINITEGFIRHNDKIDRYFLGNTKLIEKFFLKTDDLVIGMDGSKVGDNIALIKKADEGSILVQRVARLRNNNKSNIEFLFQIFISKQFKRYVYRVNTSSGIPHISSKQINDFKIFIPNLLEQEKIASFLTVVDSKIENLTRKKELIEEYKKGVMQQLFSGEIRFKNENGNDYPDWGKVKLEDVAVVSTGSSNKQDTVIDGTYKFFDRSVDILQSNKYLFDCEALIVPGEGSKFLPIYYYGKFDLHQRAYAIFNFKKILPKYLYYFMFFNKNYLIKYAVGSTVKSLRLPVFNNMIIISPSIGEQEKISTFLDKIDNKINLIEFQIEKTEKFKKGLLQQMFV
jgi:type I restriction enzyme, S subunit